MQDIHLKAPYRFIPPHEGTFWVRLFYAVLPRYLRRVWGVSHVECLGVEHLRASLAARQGVLLAPNHCRPCDPMLLGMLGREASCYFYIMASAHLFYQGKFQRWLLPRGGAFSVYREGLDKAALEKAIDVLAEARRPLILFPEGVISRSNDRLNGLMEGLSTIVRAAQKRQSSAGRSQGVAVHPVAIRYFFHGELGKDAAQTLREIEARLTWLSSHDLSLTERCRKIGRALLSLKEIEYFDEPQNGTLAERLERLIDKVLTPIEEEWAKPSQKESQKGTIVSRVKKLRSQLLPDLIKGDISEEEKQRRWRQLTQLYYAQQISFYPADYLVENAPQEHILETIERFEEDLTDVARIYQPLSAVIQVGAAMPVEQERERQKGGSPLVSAIENELVRMIEELKSKRPAVENK